MDPHAECLDAGGEESDWLACESDTEDMVDGNHHMDRASTAKVRNKLHTDGYRIGKQAGEEKEMQVGFDAGFNRGMKVGKICGQFLGTLKSESRSNRLDGEVLRRVESILLEEIPRMQTVDRPSMEAMLAFLSTQDSDRVCEAYNHFLDAIGSPGDV